MLDLGRLKERELVSFVRLKNSEKVASAVWVLEIDGGPTSAMVARANRLRRRRNTMTDRLCTFHAANPGGRASGGSISATGLIMRGIGFAKVSGE